MRKGKKGDSLKPMYLGIDTSNYTTSLALINQEGELLEDKRILLPVQSGNQGLQQSTALFYHIKNLPVLIKSVFDKINGKELLAVAASARPRPQQESYMPVFTAGLGLAQSLAEILQIPFFSTTHQEGHVAAGLWSAGCEELDNFLVIHLSGGTTDLLLVKRQHAIKLQYDITLLGSSGDIHAGQLIDRVGVAIGLDFPCGPALEKLAANYGHIAEKIQKPINLPSSVQDFRLSFSGAETKAKRYLADKTPPEAVARAVEQCIANSLEKVLKRAVEKTKIREIVLVGGVAANVHIRERLRKRLEHKAVGAKLYFPEPKFCSDNAVGVGLIARSMIY